ncbi:diadenylate cyclase CdaA [Enterococcus nangangensis]|uniref:diadenylate cyclase CdaA n=1 Tax=Enterococcus nangangensis TaxID=2559926 RepID=UPI0010F7DE5E|nr:diadenylate cyclase CdaA [Enterococcus nangangensis]
MNVNLSQFFEASYWQELFTSNLLSWSFLVKVLDILVVWFVVYKLIMLVRGTKAVQLLKGVVVFFVLRLIAGLIGLTTVLWIMNQIITYGVIAAIVIFQPEVRRGLEHIGRSSFWTPTRKEAAEEDRMVKAFDKAIQYMAKRKIGALVTIERSTGLDEYVETGIPLDADITGELLINIFIPNTPLHDGAVIIKNNKIAVSCAYLPLSESQLIPKEFGTRHRAAIGISEVSDALTFVVSEETGDVSITLNNTFIPHLSQDEYLKILHQELVERNTKDKDEKKRSLLQQFIEGISLSKGGKK